jgi:hypothetical protein
MYYHDTKIFVQKKYAENVSIYIINKKVKNFNVFIINYFYIINISFQY